MHHGQIEGTDLVVLDNRFGQLFAGYMRVTRHWTGSIWAEGPAWFAAGRYLIWSDIPNNRMLRLVEESGQVSVFRTASNNSNGNTVDNQGRLVTCEHLTRRVTRTEFDGSISSSPTSGRASASTRRTTPSSSPTIRSGSPTRPTASTATTRASRPSPRSTAATSIALTPRAARSPGSSTTWCGQTALHSRPTRSSSMSPRPARRTRRTPRAAFAATSWARTARA